MNYSCFLKNKKLREIQSWTKCKEATISPLHRLKVLYGEVKSSQFYEN